MNAIKESLADHRFQHLFIECLGWDRIRVDALSVLLGGSRFSIEGIAQKRGFVVFACPTHRTVLSDRQSLRSIQKAIRKNYHEHIIVHYSDTPKKQVWQWTVQEPGGRGVRHHEHPFFSDNPPPKLLDRLNRLTIRWEEEEKTTLVGVLGRVREVLLPQSEFNLFVRKPFYARRSDALAMAVTRGEPGAFDEFVRFHIPLARKASRMLVRWFAMSPDDAEQIAMIGLLEAAKRFDPERGYQFSTYASFWLRQVCRRYGLEWGYPIRPPDHTFWPCFRMQYVEAELISTWGEVEAREKLIAELSAAGIELTLWERFRRARDLACFSDIDPIEIRYLTSSSRQQSPFDATNVSVLRDDILNAIASLPPKQSQILLLRYGIGQPEHTLQEVADLLGLSRERVRQLQVKAEERLQLLMTRLGYDDTDAIT